MNIDQLESGSLSVDQLELGSLTILHWIGIYLAVISAVVYLPFGIGFFPYSAGITFLLVTGGFISGIVLLLIDHRRRQLYLAGILYASILIVEWYIIESPAGFSDIGLVKIVDDISLLGLIVVLITLYRWDW